MHAACMIEAGLQPVMITHGWGHGAIRHERRRADVANRRLHQLPFHNARYSLAKYELMRVCRDDGRGVRFGLLMPRAYLPPSSMRASA